MTPATGTSEPSRPGFYQAEKNLKGLGDNVRAEDCQAAEGTIAGLKEAAGRAAGLPAVSMLQLAK